MLQRYTLILGAFFVLAKTAVAFPVIPGASGFGIETPAGRGGQVIRVTNLSSSGSGSLKACIDAEGPRTCVFEVAGNINRESIMWIRNPNLTIAGQTAPHPGITLLGAGLRIAASDVLVQHIAIRPGDRLDGPGPGLRDALVIGGNDTQGTISNVVIDHCSFSWSIDELVSMTYGFWDNVTIRNSVFAFPLDDSLHPKTSPPGDGNGHGLGMLVGEGPGRADVSGSLFAHIRARNPLARSAGLVFRNNVIYNHRRVGTELQDGDRPSMNDIVNNVYIEGVDSFGRRPIQIGMSDSDTLVNGSKVFESGNLRILTDGTDSNSIVTAYGGDDLFSSTALFPSLSTALAVTPDSGDFVAEIATKAGRRPATRESGDVDNRAAFEVINRTGTAINCVEADGTDRCAANAGGWPDDTVVSRPLTLPTSPNGDDDNDGYTNLEEWLHEMAAAVELGNLSGQVPPPPGSLRSKPPGTLIALD